MKKSMVKKLFIAMVTIAMILQCIAVSITVSAATAAFPSYNKGTAVTDGSGVQGYQNWYFMYKSNGEYTNLPYTPTNSGESITNIFSDGTNKVTGNFAHPAANRPTVMAWKAPNTGVVTLSVDGKFYRGNESAVSNAGDVTLNIILNGEALHTQVIPGSATTNDKYTYTKTDIAVKKGDIIYHELDCGSNATAANILFKPTVQYTAFYDRNDKYYAYNDLLPANQYRSLQGYNGWTYKHIDKQLFSEDGDTWRDMVWYDNGDTGEELTGRYMRTNDNQRNEVYLTKNGVNYGRIAAGWSGPTAIVWTAPYSGEIELTCQNNSIYWISGDAGFDLKLYLNTTDNMLWSKTLTTENKNESGKTINYSGGTTRIKVNAGDKLWHVVEYKNNESGFGRVYWGPRVHYISYAYATENNAVAFSSVKNGKMLIAQYNGDYLVNVVPKALTKSTTLNDSVGYDPDYTNKHEPVEHTFNWEDGTTSYKVFAWSDDGKYVPLCDAAEYRK